MTTKCIKLRIHSSADETTWLELTKLLGDLSYATCKMMNYVIRKNYLRTMAKYAGEEHDLKAYYYPDLVKEYPWIAGNTLSAIDNNAKAKWNQNAKGVLKNEVSLPTFKRNYPVPLKSPQYHIIEESGEYFIDAQLCSNKTDKTRYTFKLYNGDNSTKTILNRIIDGKYKKGEASIFCDSRSSKRKWMIAIPYQFEAVEQHFEPNRIMGVDLGINKVAYWAYNDSLKRGFINGGEIEQFRKGVRARRIAIQNQGKYCSKSRNNHGISRKLLPVDRLSERERNFRSTCNFKYAHAIVKDAVKMKCGMIQIEDLSNINKDNLFLKNWPYYDLQDKIQNKAAEHGIKVIKVDPRYTSQRCSECGHIEKQNRVDQATFICKSCGYGNKYHCFGCGKTQRDAGNCVICGADTKLVIINADYNAARNLAIKDIDSIIIESLKCES